MSPPLEWHGLTFVRIGLAYCGRISRLWPGNEVGRKDASSGSTKGPPYLVRVIHLLGWCAKYSQADIMSKMKMANAQIMITITIKENSAQSTCR